MSFPRQPFFLLNVGLDLGAMGGEKASAASTCTDDRSYPAAISAALIPQRSQAMATA